MKKLWSSIILILIMSVNCFGQNVNSHNNSSRLSDSFVLTWHSHLKGNSWSYIKQTVKDINGDLISIGNFNDTLTLANNKLTGSNDIFIIKQNADGEIKWMNKLWNNKDCSVNSIYSKDNGTFLITGQFNGDLNYKSREIVNSEKNNSFVASFRNNGELDWIKTFSGKYFGNDILVSSHSSKTIYLAGSFAGQLKYDSIELKSENYLSGFVLGLDSTGKLKENKIIEGYGDNIVNSISEENESICLLGSFEGDIQLSNTIIQSKGNKDMFLVELSDSLTIEKVETYGSEYDDEYKLLRFNIDGTYLTCGTFSNGLTLKNDSVLSSYGLADIFIIKHDTTGKILWKKSFGSIGNDNLSDLLITEDKNYYLTGNYRGKLWFDNDSISSVGNNDDMFLACISSDGILKYLVSSGDSATELGRNAIVKDYRNIIVSGNLLKSQKFADTDIEQSNNNSFILADIFNCAYSKGVSLPADTSLCDESYIIVADSGFMFYTWNTKQTKSNKYQVDTTGYYLLTAKDIDGCLSRDTIMVNINIPVQVDIGPDIEIEKGDTIFLSTNQVFSKYDWSTADTSRSIIIETEYLSLGDHYYRITVSDSINCKSYDDVLATIIKLENNSKYDLLVYPNPAKDWFNYTIKHTSIDGSTCRALIVDNAGKILARHDISIDVGNTTGKLKIVGYRPGVYTFLVLIDEKILQKKLTVIQ